MGLASFTLFATPLGQCGIVFGPQGVVAVLLPERSERVLRSTLRERFADAVEQEATPEIQRTIAWIERLFAGQAVEDCTARLDFTGIAPFHRRVYEMARTIGPGSTLTYGEVAQRLGSPGAARAVGQALGRNPFAIIVPCHRVVASGGRIGGFSAPGGADTKRKMLALEVPQPSPPASRASRRISTTLSRNDPALARVIDKVGALGLTLSPVPSTFFALAEAIAHQQLTGKAAQTIFGRVQALFARSRDGFSSRALLRLPEEKLRAAGLSRAKALALRDLAERDVRGEIPALEQLAEMEDEAIIEQLTAVRGIGRWTVEMLLIFRLGRPDVLPLDDYGVRKGFARLLGVSELPSKRALSEHGERWRPHRSAASWYLWRAAAWGAADLSDAPSPVPKSRRRGN